MFSIIFSLPEPAVTLLAQLQKKENEKVIFVVQVFVVKTIGGAQTHILGYLYKYKQRLEYLCLYASSSNLSLMLAINSDNF